MTILSIGEIADLLRAQAEMRAPENDEGGVLMGLADRLLWEVAALEDDGEEGAMTRVTVERDKRYGAPLSGCVVIERRPRPYFEAIMTAGPRAHCEAWAENYRRELAEGVWE